MRWNDIQGIGSGAIMKKITILLIMLVPAIAGATEVQAEDLTNFSSSMSDIVSFFAGCIAIKAFVAGVSGGNK